MVCTAAASVSIEAVVPACHTVDTAVAFDITSET
jgi:hypothetical protein